MPQLGGIQLNEVFVSIQGEGPFAGFPTLFIRAAGCNLHCTWCDTQHEKVNHSFATWRNLDDFVHPIFKKNNKVHHVCITGGEPFRQPALLDYATRLASYRTVSVETNGTKCADPILLNRLSSVFIVCSPKPCYSVHHFLQPDYYKYIHSGDLYRESDGLPIHTDPPRQSVDKDNVFLQPMDVGDKYENKKIARKVAKLCVQHGYRFSYQIHKAIGWR